MSKNKLATLATITALLAMLIATAQAATVTIPELKATPNNSHIFRVAGADFNASTVITLQLLNGTSLLHNFTESIATDSAGAFDAVVIAPTSINGTYDLTATTYTISGAANATATIKVTLPNMIGPQGPQGLQGEIGEEGHQGEVGSAGAKGETGEAANTDAFAAIAGLSLILSVIACVIALFYKKK